MGLPGVFHTSVSQNSNGTGNGNGSVHNQSSASSLTGTPGPTMQHGNLTNDPNFNHNGVSGGMGGPPTHHNGDPLTSTLPAGALQQQGDLQLRTSPISPSRDESHHHPHPHHNQQQQQLHVHHTHSSYHHGQLSGHELSPHDQQQQQFSQHSAYASAAYYGEPEQHESYEHDRVHSGGLVGHPYGNSHDTIAALTPPPSAPVPQHDIQPLRTRLTNTIWEDEQTFCFQVDVKGVCVARRADNQMVNGTKLLNVVGMSRGKRDGILKNEKGRVVVKVGAMHLKGVWIPLDRAAHHAKAHNIEESLYPLLVDDPAAFLYPHSHTSAVSSVSDMRWAHQQGYHGTGNSPKNRHSDMHSNHHFSQGIHGDYYSHQHHSVFRGHGVNSPHGSPHGSRGSISGDEGSALTSPFEYRVGAGSLVDLPPGSHHAAYYGHQANSGQYYGTHIPPKYQDSIIHPVQHQLQLGGTLANDPPPPLSTSSAHDGPQNRLSGSLLTGQKRGYGSSVPEAHSYYNNYQAHPQKSDVYPADASQFGLTSSGMSTGNFSPPMSMPSSEPHSPMSQQHQAHHPQDQHTDLQLQNTSGMARQGSGSVAQALNPPSKRPRQVSRGASAATDSSNPSSGQWYSREEGFDRSGQSNEAPGAASVNYNISSDGVYYDNTNMAQQQQQQTKSFNAAREGEAGRPRFMPGAPQTPLQYGAAGPSSPQRSRSRLSSFQDGATAGGVLAQQGTMPAFGRVPSPDESKQAAYGRAQSGPESESNVQQLIKVEGNLAHDANWS
ncbi:hypothetical protein BG011_007804 [Mortierella polycephala]|uniref:HTH APSES-type domain-containing protein n=1 Tax=Mortierella polycephala TaxID=41804 RepID=A0A9P6PR80_9FUNG|nr:hypothetical protein BG011_007804 [Mortierella polycephala]